MVQYQGNGKTLCIQMGDTINYCQRFIDDSVSLIQKIDNLKVENTYIKEAFSAQTVICFILLDLCSAYRGYLFGELAYEKRYAIKNIQVILNEGFKQLYGYDNNRTKSIWNHSLANVISHCSSDIQHEYCEISKHLSDFSNSIIFDKKARGLAVHYSCNIKERYDYFVQLNAERVSIAAIEFFKLLHNISEFINRVLFNIKMNK